MKTFWLKKYIPKCCMHYNMSVTINWKIASVKKQIALRINSDYSKVSSSTDLVVAATSPIDLLAIERNEIYK